MTSVTGQEEPGWLFTAHVLPVPQLSFLKFAETQFWSSADIGLGTFPANSLQFIWAEDIVPCELKSLQFGARIL